MIAANIMGWGQCFLSYPNYLNPCCHLSLSWFVMKEIKSLKYSWAYLQLSRLFLTSISSSYLERDFIFVIFLLMLTCNYLHCFQQDTIFIYEEGTLTLMVFLLMISWSHLHCFQQDIILLYEEENFT